MIIEEDVYLAHYGVKGMRWGVRNDRRVEGVSRKTNREARKDAQEFARARMFYGQGAGTRRKLIKNSVEAKKKRDAGYAKAFNKHLEDQDMSEHAQKARRERGRKDTRARARQTGGFFARRFTGEMGTNAAFLAVAAAGAAYLNTPAGRSRFNQTVGSVRQRVDSRRMANNLRRFMNG